MSYANQASSYFLVVI